MRATAPPAMLEGIRVIDLTRVLAGPFAGQILAELGADVVKVELPGGDPARTVGPFIGGRSLYFSSVNSGKRGVLVDPKTEVGRDLLADLIATSDVLLSNFRPTAARSLGLDYETVAAQNPAIVMVTISGFAEGSSRGGEPVYDLSIQAEAGVMAVTGTAGSDPVRAGVPISDLVSGMWAAMGAVGGLVGRGRDGTGRFLEISLLDATLPLLSYMATAAAFTGAEPDRVGSGHHSICPYGAYAARDGWLVIAILSDKFWLPLCSALGLPFADRADLKTNTGRLESRAEVDSAIAAALAGMTRAQALARLSAGGVPHAPVQRLLDALSTPYVRERGLVETIRSAQGEYSVVRSPLSQRRQLRPAPEMGEHTEEVAAEIRARQSHD